MYSQYLKGCVEFLSLHDGIVSFYKTIRYLRHSGVESQQINDTTVDFQINNRRELDRLHDLMGESTVISDMLTEVETGDVVYDVGANIGIYTWFLSKSRIPQQIIAFEPHPDNITRVKPNADLNDINPTILDKALSDSSGTGMLAVQLDSPGAGSHSLKTENGKEGIEIEIVIAHELVASGKIQPPNVLKIDVEGAEYSVLRGMESLLSRAEC
jgi:FkbM family methyltransferase